MERFINNTMQSAFNSTQGKAFKQISWLVQRYILHS